MFHNIGLYFIKGVEIAQMLECFLESTEEIIDRVLSSKQRLPLQILQERQVFFGVLLRLLSNEQSQLKVVKPKSVVE